MARKQSNGPEAVQIFLSRAETHGLASGEKVKRVETHASVVFLAGDRAWKLKKPVIFPYLDFSSRERRLAACRTELAVNRRFSPDLYLGLGAVREGDGGFVLDGPVEVLDGADDTLIEPLVVMRRFTSENQLDRLAGRGCLDAVMADRLGIMAAGAMADAEIRDIDWTAAFAEVINESLGEVESWPDLFDPDGAALLRASLTRWLAETGDLLAGRSAQGHVRRCHGDLHLGNIFCHEGRPVPFDALEFDEVLATTDVLYDLAFLLMDLHARDMPGAAARALSIALCLTDDYAGAGLLPGYMATRAIIRAKITASRFAQTGDTQTGLADEARHYFDLAARLLDRPAARLAAVGGLSGTGKTSCAFALAEVLGPDCVVIRSDVVRKHLAGLDLFDTAPESAYASEAGDRVYVAMLAAARQALAAGATVILDGVFADQPRRDACSLLAQECGVRFEGLWLEASHECRLGRVKQRGPDASDAGPSVVRRQEGAVSGAITWHRVPAEGARDAVAEAARAVLRQAQAG